MKENQGFSFQKLAHGLGHLLVWFIYNLVSNSKLWAPLPVMRLTLISDWRFQRGKKVSHSQTQVFHSPQVGQPTHGRKRLKTVSILQDSPKAVSAAQVFEWL